MRESIYAPVYKYAVNAIRENKMKGSFSFKSTTLFPKGFLPTRSLSPSISLFSLCILHIVTTKSFILKTRKAQGSCDGQDPPRGECKGFKWEHVCRDPKDGELCLTGTKPKETLVEPHSDIDEQIVRSNHLVVAGSFRSFLQARPIMYSGQA